MQSNFSKTANGIHSSIFNQRPMSSNPKKIEKLSYLEKEIQSEKKVIFIYKYRYLY
jgi:hypothetical protein